MSGYRTKSETTAYSYGRTFVPKDQDRIAPCYDERMDRIVTDNPGVQRNCRAWWGGYLETHPDANAPEWLEEQNA